MLLCALVWFFWEADARMLLNLQGFYEVSVGEKVGKEWDQAGLAGMLHASLTSSGSVLVPVFLVISWEQAFAGVALVQVQS